MKKKLPLEYLKQPEGWLLELKLDASEAPDSACAADPHSADELAVVQPLSSQELPLVKSSQCAEVSTPAGGDGGCSTP